MSSTIPIERQVSGLRQRVREARAAGRRISLVPTMGALHAGHLSLVGRAREAADLVIVSIFVNPTQFGPDEDYGRYPRQEAQDARLLDSAGAGLIFAPGLAEVYPAGMATQVSAGPVGTWLCGAYRPGHFDGVATIVTKLLMMALPDVAVFGEKDYQQLLIIRQVVRDLNLPVEIIGAPLIRDADGLALSSRNAYLTADQRGIALALPRTLTQLAEALRAGDPVPETLARGRSALLEAGFDQVDYLELRDGLTLAPLTQVKRSARLLGAARLTLTRLIDNVAVG